MKRRLLQLLRLGASLILAVWLIQLVVAKGGADLVAEFKACNPWPLVLATLLFGLGPLLSCVRWGKLLQVQSIELSFWDLLRLTMIGVFFNLALPGGVGGDLLKMVYVQQHARGREAEAVMTILIDRILGLLGLFAVALIAVAFSWNFLMGAPPAVRYTCLLVAAIALAGALGMAILLLNRTLRRLPGVEAVVKAGKSVLPGKVVSTVSRIVRAVDLYRENSRVLVVALLISMVIHSSVAFSVMCIGLAFHAQGLHVRDYFLATQVANTISAIPITPGGLGGRDVVLALFFQAAGGAGSKSGVIPPVMSMVIVFWGLVGGLFFIFERKSEHAQVEQVVEQYLDEDNPVERDPPPQMANPA